MEVLARSDSHHSSALATNEALWESSKRYFAERGNLFRGFTFLAQPLLAHCQCGHFEGSRQMYGYLDMPVVELGESSIVWSS